MNKKPILFLLIGALLVSGCATGRDFTSERYLPEWENQVLSFPAPNETSAGYWAEKTVEGIGKTLARIVLTPPAILGNALINLYYIPTWPLRWLLRGDKRLIVWHDMFHNEYEIGSAEFAEVWTADLV